MATLSDLSLDRGLPASVEAERSILGAILLDNPSYNEAAEKLRADDFSLDSHRRIYSRMAEMIDAHRAVDIVTLAEELSPISRRSPRVCRAGRVSTNTSAL
jgi:replicative DNA helicase